STASLEQILYSVWFVLICSIASEHKVLHLLSSAFKVLYDARLCGVILEEEVFLRIIRACGACGIPDKSIEILGIMQESGYTPDAATYTQLLQAFSMTGDL